MTELHQAHTKRKLKEYFQFDILPNILIWRSNFSNILLILAITRRIFMEMYVGTAFNEKKNNLPLLVLFITVHRGINCLRCSKTYWKCRGMQLTNIDNTGLQWPLNFHLFLWIGQWTKMNNDDMYLNTYDNCGENTFWVILFETCFFAGSLILWIFELFFRMTLFI